MARGLLLKSVTGPSDLTLTTLHAGKLERYSELGCRLTLNNAEAVKDADIVILAVRRQDVVPVIREIRSSLNPETQTFVCFAAGVDTEMLLSELGGGFVYAIPNTALEIGESITVLAPVNVPDNRLASVKAVFDKLGTTVTVPERLLPAGTSLASCGIAFAMLYAQAACKGGVGMGFNPDEALGIVEQAMEGAVKLMKFHGSTPEQEIEKVATPGGLTRKGLDTMEKYGFSGAVAAGLEAAL